MKIPHLLQKLGLICFLCLFFPQNIWAQTLYSNNSCSNSIGIGFSTYRGKTNTTVNTTTSLGACGSARAITNKKAVWYRINGTGRPIRAVTLAATNGSSFDTQIWVMRDDSWIFSNCTFLTCITGNDDAKGLLSEVCFNSTPGARYYIVVGGFGNNSGEFQLKVSDIRPPTTTNAVRCGPGSITLRANARNGGSLKWYTAPIGGSRVRTGSTYTFNVNFPGITLYVAEAFNGCESSRTPITVTVYPLPVPTETPDASDTLRCGNGYVQLRVTNPLPGLTYRWYDQPTGGTIRRYGITYSPYITGATKFYVASVNALGCEGPTRGVSSVSFNVPPPAPNVTNDTICAPGQALLGASVGGSTGGALKWFFTQTGGVEIPGGGSSLSVFVPITTSFYVAEVDEDGCDGNRTRATAFVISPPPPPTTISDTICGPGTVTLGASGPGLSYVWYSVPSSAGSGIFTGSSYSPLLSSTTSYWVVSSNGPCKSGIRPVEGRVYPKNPLPQAVGDESCGGDSLTLRVTGVGGQFRWFDADSAGNQVYIGDTLRDFFAMSQNLWVEEISYVTTPVFDDFEMGLNPDLWNLNLTNGIRDNGCGSFDNNALYFRTQVGTMRQATTRPLDLRQGGIITFQLKISNVDRLPSCEEADNGEDVALEFSIDGGNTFTGIDTFETGLTYQEFAAVTQKIPSRAQKQETILRLRQIFFNANAGDTWMVDNFSVEVTILSECASDRSLAQARIKNQPGVPTGVKADTICGPGIARLEGTGTGGMIEWFDAPLGGSQVGLGSVFQPNVTANTPYWVMQSDTNGCFSARIPTEVIVYPIPDRPLTVGDDICGPFLSNLRTVGSQGIVRWYDMPQGGTLVNTGFDYNPFLVNTTTYYVDEEINGCIGDRQAVTATVYPVPLPPTSIFVDTICGPGPARFEVAGAGDLLFWMDSAFNGIKIGEGPIYETQLNVSTDFYSFEASLRKAEGIPIPKQDTVSNKGVQGYWFVAPTDMVFSGLRVPLSASASDTQSVSLIRLQNMPQNTLTSDFEVLGHYPNVPSTGLITDSLPIQAGDIIGVLGIRGDINSVSGAASFDTLMGVYPVEIVSLYSPNPINRAQPDMVLSDPRMGLGRVQFFAQPACFSGRRKMAGEVIPIPPAPGVISDSICGPGVAMLTAIGTMDTLNTLHWYDADSAGTELAQGPNFNPFVDRDTIFWVEEVHRGCSSDRTPVYVVVYIVPDPPELIPDTLCGPGEATLLAIADSSGLIRWYDADTATIAIETGTRLTRFLSQTTTFYATFTDEHCESPKDSVTAIVYPIPLPPVSKPEVHVCGPDTVVFIAMGEGGTLSWYDQPTGGVPLIMGDTFKVFLMRDKCFWVEEERNGCIGPRTMVEGIVNIIPDPPTTQDDWICDDGDATVFAIAEDRFIEWYDADSAGKLINTGDAYTSFVTDTSTFWTQIPPANIDRLGSKDSSLGNGGMSDFFADGLRFDVLSPTTIKQVTVYPKDSGLVNVRLVNRFGKVLHTHQEVVDGSGEVDLLLAFPVLPGERYHLDAKGSTVSGLYRNSAGFAFPDSSQDLIITGQVNVQDGFYYFFYDWKIGHCMSDFADVSAISYPKASRTPIPATDPASYIANYECEDPEGWTHYFYDLETPELEDDLLLFSIRKDGQEIGTVGDGVFRLRVHASDNADGGGGLATPILAPYVSNTDGWFVMNRYWDIVPNPAPTRPVKIRFYYNESDLAEINNALMEEGDTIPIIHPELIFFVFEQGNANPDLGHLSIPLINYRQYRNGEFSEKNEWRYDFKPPFHYGELETAFLNSGGAGKGGNKKGALTTGALTLEPVGSHVLLTWEALSGFTGDHFEVERSFNGEEFEEIGEVDFINDSVGIQPYNYTDFFTPETKLYYRVKFVFMDGSSFFTNIESILFEKAIDTLISVYPNPTHGEVTFEFSNIVGKVTVDIISRDGKVVLTEEWTEREDLVQSIQLRRLPPGIYIYRIRFSRETLVGKLIKVN